MGIAGAVSKISHDVASRVDRIRIRLSSSRYIDGNKSTLAQQVTMSVAAAVSKVPHDVASRVDIKGKRLRGSRYIDRGKATFAK